MTGMFFLILAYVGIRKITNDLMEGNNNFVVYIEILIYGFFIYSFVKEMLYKLDIKVENIYRPQLEELLENVFSKKNLTLIKEESDEDQTIFSFSSEDIKSRIIISGSMLSTKNHTLTIENKSHIPYLEEILEDINAMIEPIPRNSVVIKLVLKTAFFTYLGWKIVMFFT